MHKKSGLTTLRASCECSDCIERIAFVMSQVGIGAETTDPHWAAAPSAEPQPQQMQIAGIIPSQPKQGRLF